MVWLLRFNHLRQHGGKAPYRVSGLPVGLGRLRIAVLGDDGLRKTLLRNALIHGCLLNPTESTLLGEVGLVHQ